MVLSEIHTHLDQPFGLTSLLSPPAATASVCLHLPFLCNPQKEGMQRSRLALSLCAGFIEPQWCPGGACYAPQTAHWNIHKDRAHSELPDPSDRPHTCLKQKWIGRSVCVFFIRKRSVPFICQWTNAAGGGWGKKGGFYCEMDVSFNGLESEAERETTWERRCRENREEALMESTVIQSFSSPNNSKRLLIPTNLLCFRGDYNCTQSDVTMPYYCIVIIWARTS